MKNFISAFIKKLILTIVGIIAFIWVFSLLFPRAYSVLEAKALGIEQDSIAVITNSDIDTTKTIQPNVVKDDIIVKLEHSDNCYYITPKVNGVPMKMLLDTGASNLAMSIVEYKFLLKQGLLKDTTAEVSQAIIANGAEVKCYTIKIDEITIDSISIKNIECNVMEEQNAPILLGMNVLRKLGNFSIDYEKNLLIIKR